MQVVFYLRLSLHNDFYCSLSNGGISNNYYNYLFVVLIKQYVLFKNNN